MTMDLHSVVAPKDDASVLARCRSILSGIVCPILFSAVMSAIWAELAFFRVLGKANAILVITILALCFASIFFAATATAGQWVKSVGTAATLKQQLARSSMASIVFLLYLPEYTARLQPPALRSSLLLGLVSFLWLALCAASISHERNIHYAGKKINFAAVSAILLIFALVTILAIRKYLVFGYVGQDLAYFVQILHTTLHGHLFWGSLLQDLLYTRPVTTDFAGHNSPVMFLFLPFYATYQSPITLILLRNTVLFASAIPVFLLARRRVSLGATWIWTLAFLLTPTILYQSTFDFYPLSFAVLPVLCALYFYAESRYTAFCIALAATLLVREDLVFFVFGMGLIAIIHRRSIRWSVMPLLVSGAWAAISFALVLPGALHGAKFVTDQCFCHLGHGPGEMLRSVLTHPRDNVLLRDNLVYLKTIFTPTALFLSLSSLFSNLAIPYLVINLLAGGGSCITNIISTQYSVIPAALLFSGALLASTKQRPSFMTRMARLGLSNSNVIPLLALTLSCAGLTFATGEKQAAELSAQPWTAEANRVLSMIPADASVAAPRYMLPHLANRDCLYQTHRLSEYHSATYEYLIIDPDWSHIDASHAYLAEYRQIERDVVQQATFQLIYSSPRYQVYQNQSTRGRGCFPPPTLAH